MIPLAEHIFRMGWNLKPPTAQLFIFPTIHFQGPFKKPKNSRPSQHQKAQSSVEFLPPKEFVWWTGGAVFLWKWGPTRGGKLRKPGSRGSWKKGEFTSTTWNAKCPIFCLATLPLKPATIAFKLGHLAFQVWRFFWMSMLVLGGFDWVGKDVDLGSYNAKLEESSHHLPPGNPENTGSNEQRSEPETVPFWEGTNKCN